MTLKDQTELFARLGEEGRVKAFRHELEHIKNGDFYSDLPVSEKELNSPF